MPQASWVPPIPETFFDEVGRLCAAWAFLEYALELEIWHLLDLDGEAGSVITDRLDVRGCWDFLLKVSQQKGSDLYPAYKASRATINQLAADRNLIVHGLIDWYDPEPARCWSIKKGEYAGQRIPISTEFVIATREGIRDMARQIRPGRHVREQDATPLDLALARREPVRRSSTRSNPHDQKPR